MVIYIILLMVQQVINLNNSKHPCGSLIEEFDIAYVVCTFDDPKEFAETIASIDAEIGKNDLVVVVDSSRSKSIALEIINSTVRVRDQCRYYWIRPNGVYAAINFAIRNAPSVWIQVINSGDRLLNGSRVIINKAIQIYPGCKIHIFSQISGFNGRAVNFIHPQHNEIWPHQSIIVHKLVHEQIGYYNESYRIVSDQLFFAEARMKYSFVIHDEALTYYDLDGISSRVGFRQSRELFVMWRSLGKGLVNSIYRSFITPRLRWALELIFGKPRVAQFKRVIRSRIYSSSEPRSNTQ